MALLSLFRRRTIRHGIHPPDNKQTTCNQPIRRFPFAPELVVPLSQHIGAPAIPQVKLGQEVVRGQVIAHADGFMSVPIHAPATGVVKTIDLMPTARGPRAPAILIKVYQGDTQEVMRSQRVDLQHLNAGQLVQATQDCGMAGLGGAAFPSHVKFKVPPEHNIHTLVVNGSECEPYLTTDHRVMLERPEQLLAGIRLVRKAIGAERAVIGIEDNKLDAVRIIREYLRPDDLIEVTEIEAKYPQGAEKMLVKSLLGVEIPSGGLPSQVGLMISNTGTLAALGELLPLGQGLIERVVTITGSGVKKPGNYNIPLGTPLRFVLHQLGIKTHREQIILGGPMMGAAVASLDVPITKGTSGVLVFAKDALEQAPHVVMPCIRCGRCLNACPVMLNPSELGLLAGKRQYEAMATRYHLNDCIECGCCSYVCPANIPLVQYFRIAKTINREQTRQVA